MAKTIHVCPAPRKKLALTYVWISITHLLIVFYTLQMMSSNETEVADDEHRIF